MKVVIIAAGDGGRLRRKNKNIIKPLIPILGVSLIERVILSCKEAGFNDFVVVVGFKKDNLVPCLNKIAEKQNITLQVAENAHWQKGNGTSVLACERFVGEPFILLMCDHIFDPQILQGLIQERLSSDECVLAVDTRTNEIF
ncbi:MAG: NTP transferase domain-containing protein, partial [Candidatus Zixiibacteriota bacterium]